MDVILLQDVEKVGLRGEVVSVARGYMRNYLGPRRLAEEATPARVAELERREVQRARHEAATFDQAQELADALGKAELRFDVNAGPQGTLFGSVTPTDIADELWSKHKIRVDRRKIDLPEPIKRVGRYQVPIELFQDVVVEVKTLVVPEGGETTPEQKREALAVAEEQGEAAEDEAAAGAAAAVEEAIAEVEADEVEADEVEAEGAEGPTAAEPAEAGEPEAGASG